MRISDWSSDVCSSDLYDGPVAPIPLVNPAVVRPVYEKLEGDRAFIVSEASSHAQWTNYPLLPTAQWGFDIAKTYSVAWMDYQLSHDPAALAVQIGRAHV